MRRSGAMPFSFPPFTRAVKWIIGVAAGMFFLTLLLEVGSRDAAEILLRATILVPDRLIHGELWRLVTYGFVPRGLYTLLFSLVLGVWMFGSQLEMDFGTRKFVEFYFWCLIGAGLFTTAVAYTGLLGMNAMAATWGLSAPVTAIFLAWGMLYPNQEIMLLFPPVAIKAKYMAAIMIVISFAIALSAAASRSGLILSMPTFGGLLFAFIYVRFVPRGGLRYIFSERYYGIRNSYYRWKRRRAARKFEVYMRQHKREDYFDEYGNYKDPAQRKDDKGNGESRGGWVN